MRDTYDNPTVTVYDPATGYFSPDARDMADQLETAWWVLFSLAGCGFLRTSCG